MPHACALAAMQLLWPRVKSLVDLNVDSVKKCAEAPRSLGSIDTRPHYVCSQYNRLHT
jgi:hypothetical protein